MYFFPYFFVHFYLWSSLYNLLFPHSLSLSHSNSQEYCKRSPWAAFHIFLTLMFCLECLERGQRKDDGPCLYFPISLHSGFNSNVVISTKESFCLAESKEEEFNTNTKFMEKTFVSSPMFKIIFFIFTEYEMYTCQRRYTRPSWGAFNKGHDE